MRIRLSPADNSGCGTIRVNRVVETINRLYPELDICQTGRDPKGEISPGDILVLQRPMSRTHLDQIIPAIHAAGGKVVFELDDNFEALPASNPAFLTTHPQTNPNVNRFWLRKNAFASDFVTCTTQKIADVYAPNRPYAVLPNCVPDWFTQIDSPDTGKVGWYGAECWHVDDLAIIKGRLSAGPEYVTIGDEKTLKYFPEGTQFVPYQHIDKLPYAIAQLSVGIVPLADNQFNQGKSWLKALEMSAVGCFPIMLPSADNIRLHEQYGIGEIVPKVKNLDKRIRYWLDHTTERLERTHTARTVVHERLTYETNARHWIEAWTDA